MKQIEKLCTTINCLLILQITINSNVITLSASFYHTIIKWTSHIWINLDFVQIYSTVMTRFDEINKLFLHFWIQKWVQSRAQLRGHFGSWSNKIKTIQFIACQLPLSRRNRVEHLLFHLSWLLLLVEIIMISILFSWV